MKSVIRRDTLQIGTWADPEQIKNTNEKAGDYLDLSDQRIQIQQRVLACQNCQVRSKMETNNRSKHIKQISEDEKIQNKHQNH